MERWGDGGMTNQEICELLEGVTEDKSLKTLLVEYARTKYCPTTYELCLDMSINDLIDKYTLDDCYKIRVYLLTDDNSLLIYEDWEMVV